MLQQRFSRVNAGNVAHGKVMKLRKILEHCSLSTKIKWISVGAYHMESTPNQNATRSGDDGTGATMCLLNPSLEGL